MSRAMLLAGCDRLASSGRSSRLPLSTSVNSATVHRTRDGAGPIALGLLAQIDQRNHPPDKTLRFVSRISPAVLRHLLLVQPLAHVRRDGDVHHLRIGQAKARHQRGVVLDVVHLKIHRESTPTRER